ncbi:hypothetical protein D9615_007811 [Tricholomella constricta]|uniref:GED domain-containing protein n=1 Tax=Tricholomella constricta TaxID=117010 RepID=A0A8H5H576_9AGAR|nr:hypothetical protein D9615_007811 [Tricholomella constricta]
MTKPDMLTAGATKARDIWLDIIEGRRHPLVHGYYCTRQPDDAQRASNITVNEARAAEAGFFASTHPWSVSPRKDRFGTIHLVSSLSKLLVGIINETLPRITAEAATKLNACDRELRMLPNEIEGDPATYMLKLLTGFCDDVQHAVYDGLKGNQLIHQNGDAYRAFKSAIRQSAPNFIPAISYTRNGSEDHDGTSRTSLRVDELTRSTSFYLNDMRDHIRKSITRELPNNVPYSSKAFLINKFQAGWQSAVDVCFAAVREQMEKMLEKRIEKVFYRYDNLKGHIRIFVSEIMQSHYDLCSAILQPLLKVEATPFTQNTHYLADSHAKWLSIYKDARSKGDVPSHNQRKRRNSGQDGQPLKKRRKTDGGQAPVPSKTKVVKSPAVPAKDSRAKKELAPVKAKSSKRKHAPKDDESSDESSSDDSEDEESSDDPPQKSENKPSSDDHPAVNINKALAALSALGYHGLTAEDLGKLKAPDDYETELNVMAEVRGYFQIAYKASTFPRVIDNVPAMIDHMFVKAIAENMQSSLISKLALGTTDATERCSMYLAENPMVVVRRKELAARKQRLEEVKHALQTFGLS